MEKKKRLAILIVAHLWTLIMPAQKEYVINIDTTFIFPSSMNGDELKQKAEQLAILSGMAKKFGKTISVEEYMNTSSLNGQTKEEFSTLISSETGGIWLENIKGPVFGTIRGEDGQWVVPIKLTFRSRERKMAKIGYVWETLRNGCDHRFSSTTFADGDDMYISFKSPIDGYLMIFAENNDTVDCLLPYLYQSNKPYGIGKKHEYIFFSESEREEFESKDMIDQITVTCGNYVERNKIHVIFSPNMFAKNEIDYLRRISLKEFHKWRSKLMSIDSEVQYQTRIIQIQPQNNN